MISSSILTSCTFDMFKRNNILVKPGIGKNVFNQAVPCIEVKSNFFFIKALHDGLGTLVTFLT